MNFSYAHLADLHLGCWRHQSMRNLAMDAFVQAIDHCIQQKVDFVLFAGDLFHTSLPPVDILKTVTKTVHRLKLAGIPLYVIAGSHDFSPSGKTMLDVLEHADLLTNVCKGTVNEETKALHLTFTTDRKTGAKLTGILGRRGLLDKTYYQHLHQQELEEATGYKIFLFHTTITELKPKSLEKLESQPASFLPKKFNYYAGGHIHVPTQVTLPEYGLLTYTGPLYPTNFHEVESLQQGGFYIIQVGDQQTINFVPLKLKNVHPLRIDCSQLTVEQVHEKLIRPIPPESIITLRLHGKLNGKLSDLKIPEFPQAYCTLTNFSKLSSTAFEEISVGHHDPEAIQQKIIQEHMQQHTTFTEPVERQTIIALLTSLNQQKAEGETTTDFEHRIAELAQSILNL